MTGKYGGKVIYMSNIAIIPARGGSTRIPRKNIREFFGKPVIAYSIEAALNSGIFDEVMVSTDDEEIAEIARRYGASVPFMRSAKNSDAYATTRDVLLEVLAEYEKRGMSFESMACIYPCAIFVTPEKLNAAYNLMRDTEGANAVTPVVAYSYPPQRAMVVQNHFLTYAHMEYINTRTQDLEPVYHDCGQFYFWDVNDYKDNMSGVWNTVPFVTSEEECQDVDNESDFRLAEMKFAMMRNK